MRGDAHTQCFMGICSLRKRNVCSCLWRQKQQIFKKRDAELLTRLVTQNAFILVLLMLFILYFVKTVILIVHIKTETLEHLMGSSFICSVFVCK